MSKLSKRITAMLLSGMLVIGSVSGSVFAASTDVDPGQTSEIAEEMFTEDTSEEPVARGETSEIEETSEAPASTGDLTEEASAEESQYYTVTLDANGGYFENEWDDSIGDYSQQVEVVEKHIPVDGSVAAFPVFTGQDGQAMLFAGWSLERDGELESQAEEEYVPVDNCVLYAVWRAEDVALGEIGEQEVADEDTEQADSVRESEEFFAAEEASADVVTSEGSPVEEDVVTDFTEDTSDVPAAAGETTQFEDTSEAPEGAGQTGKEASAEEAAQYYTVTLDANGGYFENEWDDAVGDYVEQAVTVTRQIPVDGNVAVVPVFNDQEGQNILFAGWSLEPDGEVVSLAEEEYIPVENCVLYAVWEIAEDASLGDTDEEAGLADTEQEAKAGYEDGQVVEETKAGYEDTETEEEEDGDTETAEETEEEEESESAPEYEDTDVAEDTDTDQETAEDQYTAPETDNEQDTAPAREVIYSEEEEEETSEEAVDTSNEQNINEKLSQKEAQNDISSVNPRDIEIITSGDDESVSEDSAKSAATSIDTTYYTLKSNGTLYIHSDCYAAHNALLTGVNVHALYEEVTLNSGKDYTDSAGTVHSIVKWREYVNPHVEEIVIEDDKEDGDDDGYVLPLLVKRFPNVKKITVNSERSIDLRGGLGREIHDADDMLEYQACKEWYQNGISTWNSMFSNKLYLDEEVYYDGRPLMGEDVDYSKNLTIKSFNYDYYDITFKERIEELGASFEEITCKLDRLKSVVADDSVFYDGKSHKTDIEKEMHIICENDHGVESALWHKILTKDKHFTVEYFNKGTNKKNDITNAGSVQVTVKGIDGHTGTLTGYFIIKPQALSSANAILSETSYTYDGKAKKPSVTIKNKAGSTLKEGTDYTVAYKNNTNVGTATVTITGKGNYTGNATKTFKINKAAQSITAKAGASRVAVGKTTTVSITGNKGKKSYKSSNTAIATVDSSTGKVTAKKVGTVKITATSAATSNYNAASKTVTIKVVPAATASLTAANQATGIKLTWKKVTGATGYRIYRGSTLIKKIAGGSTVNFTDTKANTNGAKYTYKLYATASTGVSTLHKSRAIYRIARPAITSLKNSVSKKMTVKWGKNAKATGYQIQYSTSKSFASGNKTATITSASTVSKVIASQTKGKTYYVRIRTYKTVGSTKYWSTWSASKSVKITK